jgi:hypothetical protein
LQIHIQRQAALLYPPALNVLLLHKMSPWMIMAGERRKEVPPALIYGKKEKKL